VPTRSLNFFASSVGSSSTSQLSSFFPIQFFFGRADAMQGDSEKYLRQGMNGYVAKPIEMAVLAEISRVSLRSWRHGPRPRR
jgi:CheY-like chemotaxis protein